MGEVYRATDTTLGREVAIKVLPAEVAGDAERLARFEREARLLAALNHPSIAHVYGFESAARDDGSRVHFLAMELVEGEDLAERLERGAVPVEEALGIVRQMAEALEEAHEKGIVHRDLKPANVKVTPDDKVKVLDFGLAKALADEGAPGPGGDLSRSPTVTRMGTQAGIILGTAAYMSPEQARGKMLDKRADIWAFGVVLFEMLTGRRLFEGDTVSDILANVLKQEVDWKALPATTPWEVRRLLARCLERNPKNRLHDIADARLVLAGAPLGALDEASARGPEGGRRATGVTAALAVLALALLTLAAWGWLRDLGAPPEQPLVRFPLSADSSLRIQTGYTTPFAVSPDGRTIVFLAVTGDAKPHLWVRTLDDPRPRRLEGTEEGGQPAISPDGEWVAFVARTNQIKKVRLSGGPATHLATIESWSAALAWASNDEVVLEIWGAGIHRVSAQGGTPELLIPLDTAAHEWRQRRPFVLRRERAIVYASMTKDAVELVLFSLASRQRARLGVDGIQALGVIDGHLVFARADGALMAAPFDVRGMHLTGAARPLHDRVASSIVGTAVVLSERGTLVYRSADAAALRLLLVDAQGRVQPLGPEARAFEGPRFSPDGRRVVVAIDSRAGMAAARGETDLWMIDRQSGEATRLTRTGRAATPAWAPDGKRVVYIAGTPPAPREVWTLPIDGSAEPRRLVEIEGDVAEAVLAPDGRSLVAVRSGASPSTEQLIRVVLDGTASASPRVIASLLTVDRRPALTRISPDGRWVAFMDGAAQELYVRGLEGAGSLQVTDGGGFASPAWGPDSRHLYYSTGHGWAVAELQAAPSLAVVGRRSVGEFGFLTEDYDLSPDGQTFVVVAPVGEGADVLVAAHWDDEVRRSLRGRE